MINKQDIVPFICFHTADSALPPMIILVWKNQTIHAGLFYYQGNDQKNCFLPRHFTAIYGKEII